MDKKEKPSSRKQMYPKLFTTIKSHLPTAYIYDISYVLYIVYSIYTHTYVTEFRLYEDILYILVKYIRYNIKISL